MISLTQCMRLWQRVVAGYTSMIWIQILQWVGIGLTSLENVNICRSQNQGCYYYSYFLVLIEGLSFANGLTISPDEDYLLVVESAKQAVWKYHLAGKNAGQKEFFSKMPGIPDNITPSGGDGYLIGITFPTTTSGLDKILHHIRSFHPLVRLTVRLIRLIQLSFHFINQFVIKTELAEMLGMNFYF